MGTTRIRRFGADREERRRRKNQLIALAYLDARAGNEAGALAFLRQAEREYNVSPAQLKRLERLLEQAKTHSPEVPSSSRSVPLTVDGKLVGKVEL